jgi:hypothetical protein
MFNLGRQSRNHPDQRDLRQQGWRTRWIASVQANSPHDAQFERKIAKDGSAFFVLTAANGKAIGSSEMYSSTAARDEGIKSVSANGGTKTIKEAA